MTATALRLDDTSWIATAIRIDDQPRDLVEGSQLRLGFAGGRVAIHAGCNQMSAGYSVSGAEVTIEQPASTMMAGPPALMAQDAWVGKALTEQPLTGRLTGDTLTLVRPGAEIVFGSRATVSPDAALIGTLWRLDAIRANHGVASIPEGVVATLQVSEDGRATIATGCNNGGAEVRVLDGTLVFDKVFLTRRHCEGDRGETESSVVSVLEGEVAFQIVEKTLTLTNGDRGLVYRAP